MNEIEKQFYETLKEVLERGFVIVQDHRLEVKKEDEFYIIPFGSKTLLFEIESQPKNVLFSGYIPDFAIYMNNMLKGFVIEIDGHEWHEKTKEQVKADKEKDRAYLKNNFIPVRFAGSEVYHNAKRCVDELIEILFNNYNLFDFMNQKMEMDFLEAMLKREKNINKNQRAFIINSNNQVMIRKNEI